MFIESKGGIIKDSNLDGNNVPDLFRRVANELEEHKNMRLESINVIRYPTSYEYLNHGFTIELELSSR